MIPVILLEVSDLLFSLGNLGIGTGPQLQFNYKSYSICCVGSRLPFGTMPSAETPSAVSSYCIDTAPQHLLALPLEMHRGATPVHKQMRQIW